MGDLAEMRVAPNRTSYGARLRFGLAGILRRSERIVGGMVSGYEKLCRVDDADSADIYLSMGEDFARSGNAGDATAALERALAIRPESASGWFRLGVVHLREGSAEKSIEAFQTAAECGLDTFELHFYMAEALSELNRQADAAVELDAALEKDPHAAEAAYRLGVVLDQLKRYDDAVEAFKRAIEEAPREVSYYQSLGFTLESMDRRDEALECFKRAIDLERRAGR